jgi:hypothetical protein
MKHWVFPDAGRNWLLCVCRCSTCSYVNKNEEIYHAGIFHFLFWVLILEIALRCVGNLCTPVCMKCCDTLSYVKRSFYRNTQMNIVIIVNFNWYMYVNTFTYMFWPFIYWSSSGLHVLHTTAMSVCTANVVVLLSLEFVRISQIQVNIATIHQTFHQYY